MHKYSDDLVTVINKDSIEAVDSWESPTVIICDGPYGVKGFKGDLVDTSGIAEWYAPHLKKWAKLSSPLTTLWFWGTEISWAETHPAMVEAGWQYVSCNIWDKGIQHVAGNVNTQSIRRLPVVSEICAQYVRKAQLPFDGKMVDLKVWLRKEWKRTGLPLTKTNVACGVANAATRKYFTECHLWYFPPPDMFQKISDYANTHGKIDGRPYFSLDGGRTAGTSIQWAQMRAKFRCPMATTNVWNMPALRNNERLKIKAKAVHTNQKPLALMDLIIKASSDQGDVVWEPFGGLFSACISARRLQRKAYGAEIAPEVFEAGVRRFKSDASELLFPMPPKEDPIIQQSAWDSQPALWANL